jgi:propionyl-CoA synthetase
VVLNNNKMPLHEVAAEIVQMVRQEIGPIAALKTVFELQRLPKTRSGKTLRKLLRAIFDGIEYKVPSTIDDPSVIEEIKESINNNLKLAK